MSWRNTMFCKIHSEPIRKNGQNETITEKRNKMGADPGTKYRLQQPETKLTTQPCLAHYNGNKENIVTTDACSTGLGIVLWQRQNNGELKATAYASRYLNDAEKKYSVGELELLAVVWGLERFRFHLYGKQIQLFSNHQALEPHLERSKRSKQYSARLTRWLDRLNHFDITLKYTAGKEIKFTDFISQNPTETAEPEENYEEEFVINAIAQLAMVNSRIGRIFD